jgi:enoyl-[acyl-carrier-protein] reductase (NADH)
MKALIFGSSGSIGKYIFDHLQIDNIECIGTTTNQNNINEKTIYIDIDNLSNLLTIENIDIVVWAQGHNFNDNINSFNSTNFINNNKINDGSKMVIVSSIWEELTRENKLSYSISKAALSGLVKNVSYDLSFKNILINNVLPGVIDNEMSQKTLLPSQFDYIKNYMQFGRLITLDDIYKTVKFLTTENSGITGQSIKVDLGFTILKKYN